MSQLKPPRIYELVSRSYIGVLNSKPASFIRKITRTAIKNSLDRNRFFRRVTPRYSPKTEFFLSCGSFVSDRPNLPPELDFLIRQREKMEHWEK